MGSGWSLTHAYLAVVEKSVSHILAVVVRYILVVSGVCKDENRESLDHQDFLWTTE